MNDGKPQGLATVTVCDCGPAGCYCVSVFPCGLDCCFISVQHGRQACCLYTLSPVCWTFIIDMTSNSAICHPVVFGTSPVWCGEMVFCRGQSIFWQRCFCPHFPPIASTETWRPCQDMYDRRRAHIPVPDRAHWNTNYLHRKICLITTKRAMLSGKIQRKCSRLRGVAAALKHTSAAVDPRWTTAASSVHTSQSVRDAATQNCRFTATNKSCTVHDVLAENTWTDRGCVGDGQPKFERPPQMGKNPFDTTTVVVRFVGNLSTETA